MHSGRCSSWWMMFFFFSSELVGRSTKSTLDPEQLQGKALLPFNSLSGYRENTINKFTHIKLMGTVFTVRCSSLQEKQLSAAAMFIQGPCID